jgi:hypothetical protein
VKDSNTFQFILVDGLSGAKVNTIASKLARGVRSSAANTCDSDALIETTTARRWRTALACFEYLGGLVLAIAWLRSSSAHLANPYFFLSSVYRYELVGPTMGRVIAMILPFLQLFLAICLIGRMFVGGALLLSTLLFATFLTVQISAISRGLKIACGCFGAISSDQIGTASILMVSTLLLIALLCLGCNLFLGVPPNGNSSQE